MLVKLISFCDGFDNNQELISRFKEQAEQCEFIDAIRVFDLESLPIDARIKEVLGKFIEQNPRGFGYWIWKPYLLSKIAQESNFGDMLVYCDIGCEFSKAGGREFQRYINYAKNNGIGCFYTGNGDPEYVWTKSELIRLLRLPQHEIEQEQVSATFFMITVSQQTIDFLNQWVCISSRKNYLYLNDKLFCNQSIKFKEHRHDQSIFSLLIKKHEISPLKERTEYPRKFYYKNSFIYKYPVHTLRNKSKNKIINIDNYIKFGFLSHLKFQISFLIFRINNRLCKKRINDHN